jgi:hypothetical protein
LKGGDSNTNSIASYGCLSEFKARHGFTNVKMSGDAPPADTEASKKFPVELRDIRKRWCIYHYGSVCGSGWAELVKKKA